MYYSCLFTFVSRFGWWWIAVCPQEENDQTKTKEKEGKTYFLQVMLHLVSWKKTLNFFSISRKNIFFVKTKFCNFFYRGLLLSKDVMMEADIRPFSASPGPRRIWYWIFQKQIVCIFTYTGQCSLVNFFNKEFLVASFIGLKFINI